MLDQVDDGFHIPVGANRDPSDRAYLRVFPDNYDQPGPRFYTVEGTRMIEGSPNGIGFGEKWYQQSIVGPDRSLSMYVFEYIGDIPLRLHFHDVDQIGIITRGEAWFGNRRVRVGEGIFMPAGNAYGLTPGHLGVTMFEFRKRTPFRYGIPNEDKDLNGWVRKHEHKARFFDIETSVPEPIAPVVTPNGTIDLPGAVKTLLEPCGNDAMSIFSVTLEPGARVPSHTEDGERSLHVRGGSLRVAGSDPLRSGDGVRWPAGDPLDLEAGAGGATYLVHRAAKSWTKSTDGVTWMSTVAGEELPF